MHYILMYEFNSACLIQEPNQCYHVILLLLFDFKIQIDRWLYFIIAYILVHTKFEYNELTSKYDVH